MLIVEEKDFKKLEELGFVKVVLEKDEDGNYYDCYDRNSDYFIKDFKDDWYGDAFVIFIQEKDGKIFGEITIQFDDGGMEINNKGMEDLYNFLSLDIVKKV